MAEKIYLDHAASSPLRPAARGRMLEVLDATGNASSVHTFGQHQRAFVDTARQQVADFFAARTEDVVFTSGATEANNLVLQGVMKKVGPEKRLLTTTVEHDCVFRTAQSLDATFIPVDANGIIQLEVLATELAKGDVALVSILHASNETGVIQPLAEIIHLAHQHSVLVHTDAVQSVGALLLHMPTLGVDYLTFSGHKLGAPQGIGALVLGPQGGKKLAPVLFGGAQERGRRAGTENVAAIAALGAVMPDLVTTPRLDLAAELQSRLATELVTGKINLVAPTAQKIPHIIQLHLPGHRGEDIVIALDRQGIAISQGAACSSGRVEPSRILQAMGWSSEKAAEGIRLSSGWTTTAADLDRVAAALAALVA